MAKQNNNILILGVLAAMVIVVLGAFWFVGAQHAAASTGTQQTIQTGTGTAINLNGTGQCPTSGLAAVALQATYINTQGILTYVNTPATVYLQGQSTSAGSTTTPSAGSNTVNVNCGSQIEVTYGDNTNYYIDVLPSSTTYMKVGQVATFYAYDIAIKPVTALQTPSVFNGTTYSTNAIFRGVTAGTSLPAVTIKLTAGNGVYGNSRIELVDSYNTSEYSSVKITGPGVQTLVPAVLPAGVSTPAGFASFAVTIPALSYSNSTTLTISATTSGLNTNTLVVNPIMLYLKDGVNFVNGGVATPNQFANPLNSTSIGLATVTVGTSGSYATNNGAAFGTLTPFIVTYNKV